MSRTTRNKRPKMRLGKLLSHLQYKDGLVRDGTPTHVDSSCSHGGDCPYCISNRTFKNKRRLLIVNYD
jgi:hypothetical protein